MVCQGGPRRAGTVRPGHRRFHPERGNQGRGLLVRVRERPRTPASPSRPASGSTGCAQGARRHGHGGPAPPTAASTPWRATRPVPWACPTTWVELEIEGRHPHHLRAGVSGPTRQSLRDDPVPAVSSGRQAPMIPLDDALRPTWLFGATVHEGCDRAGYYEQGDFATQYGSPKCTEAGCWGPVVKCNVPKRGWINGIGGAPTWAGSASPAPCRGSPTGSCPSWTNRREPGCRRPASRIYGRMIRGLRGYTMKTLDEEPKWRKKGSQLLTGYRKNW